MFNGAFAEANSGTVTFPDVDPLDFLHFLRAIYPSANNSVVRAANVESLAVMADKFNAPALKAKCQGFLCDEESDHDLTDCERLILAELGNLDLVKVNVMKRIVRLGDVNQIITSYNWTPRTLDMLQRKRASLETNSARV